MIADHVSLPELLIVRAGHGSGNQLLFSFRWKIIYKTGNSPRDTLQFHIENGELLPSGQVRVDALISHDLPLYEKPHALALIDSRDPAVKRLSFHQMLKSQINDRRIGGQKPRSKRAGLHEWAHTMIAPTL